jgi:hypothetical protein
MNLNLSEVLNRHSNFFFDLFTGRINGLEIGFDLLQVRAPEILFSAIFALLARHIVDHKKLLIMPVNVLDGFLPEIFVAAKAANFVHCSPLS